MYFLQEVLFMLAVSSVTNTILIL